MEVEQAGRSLECVLLLQNWSGGGAVTRWIANPFYAGSNPVSTSNIECPKDCEYYLRNTSIATDAGLKAETSTQLSRISRAATIPRGAGSLPAVPCDQ
jgi:hypothetical protein